MVTGLSGHMSLRFSLPLPPADLYQALSLVERGKIHLCGFHYQ